MLYKILLKPSITRAFVFSALTDLRIMETNKTGNTRYIKDH